METYIPVQVVYNVSHVMPLGYFIAVYFYITGLHMGFYTTSVVATLLGKQEWKSIGKIGAVGALVVLAIAPSFLFLTLTSRSGSGTFSPLLIGVRPLAGVLYS